MNKCLHIQIFIYSFTHSLTYTTRPHRHRHRHRHIHQTAHIKLSVKQTFIDLTPLESVTKLTFVLHAHRWVFFLLLSFVSLFCVYNKRILCDWLEFDHYIIWENSGPFPPFIDCRNTFSLRHTAAYTNASACSFFWKHTRIQLKVLGKKMENKCLWFMDDLV